MKFVPFATHGQFETRKWLLGALALSPNGQTFGQMRERLKVADKLETAPAEGAVLEDAEHQTLLGVLDGMTNLGISSKDLLAVYDSVKDAGAPAP